MLLRPRHAFRQAAVCLDARSRRDFLIANNSTQCVSFSSSNLALDDLGFSIDGALLGDSLLPTGALYVADETFSI